MSTIFHNQSFMNSNSMLLNMVSIKNSILSKQSPFDISISYLRDLTCPKGAPIGGIMGGSIPGGIGAMLGGLWPMGGIPIGGK